MVARRPRVMESSEGETVTGEAEQTEFVIFRIRGELDWVRQSWWDDYRAKRGDRLTATEVSRGHTLIEAIRLTKLGNEEG